MEDSFPAEEEGITLSHTFLEMDQRRPRPPKKLQSKGPQDYSEYTLALVQSQRPEQPPRTSGKAHPFSDTSWYCHGTRELTKDHK